MPRDFWVILAVFAVLNIFVLNLFVARLWLSPENAPEPTSSLPSDCGPGCQQYINTVVKTALAKLTPVPTIKVSSIPSRIKNPESSVPVSKVRHISYLPISTSGSTQSNGWTDLSGTEFYFDKADYPGLVSIYFESNIKLFNGNGTAYVRLFDVTHGVGVQGSDSQTNSQQNSAVSSGQVSFYAGKNLYRVQAKSLTADTTIFNSGRLKITTEN